MNERENEIVARLASLDAGQKVVRGQLGPLTSQLERIAAEERHLREELGRLRYGHYGADEVDPKVVLLTDTEITSKFARAVVDRMTDRLGLWRNGRLPDGQVCLELVLIRDDDATVKHMRESIDLLLPHMAKQPWGTSRFLMSMAGCKVFGIFEHTLAMNGAYYLAIEASAGGDAGVTRIIRQYRDDVVLPNLDMALEYVRKNHFYQEKMPDGLPV